MSWVSIAFIVVYTLVILWWAHEYGRPGWRGVVYRHMRYVSLAKADKEKINDLHYAEGQEALVKGWIFLGVLVMMLLGWILLVVGLVAVDV